jgi:hypothetical protein
MLYPLSYEGGNLKNSLCKTPGHGVAPIPEGVYGAFVESWGVWDRRFTGQ